MAADRFNELTPEMQENMVQNIMSIKLDDAKLKDIMAYLGKNYINEPKKPDQIDFKSEFPPISIEDGSVKSLKMIDSRNNSEPPVKNSIEKAIEQYKNGEEINFTIEAPELSGMPADSLIDVPDFVNNDSVITGTGLALKLHSVKCLRKLHRIRSDRISMGCETIDDKNVHDKIVEFQVDKSFDVNNIISYEEPKTLKLFNLDSSYPKTFSAYILLVEKGNTGIGNLFSKFYNAIRDDLPELATFCAKAAGLEISDIGGLFIGKGVGVALDCLARWLGDSFKDDMFPLKQVFANLQSAPNGQLKSPIKKLTFKFHTAEYEVCCNWEVTKPKPTQLSIGANEETTLNNIQQIQTFPQLNQFVIFHINPS